MSENTYLEQYIERVHIFPNNLKDRLMKSLKEVKNPKNERKIKKIHEYIDYVENKRGKLPMYQKVFLELMVTDDK